jgi:predicted nucleotidyltransferase
MKTVGIVCEYNPFHSGHSRQIAEAKRLSGADTVICAMSGNFTQRGEAAVLEKSIRTRAALMGGADLVAEIPVIYAMSSAQSFARAGVRILLAAGVDGISCGSESCDLPGLESVADLLYEEPAEFRKVLADGLKQGMGYAAARQNAAESVLGPDAALLREPNDILAVEYLLALREYGAEIPLYLVKRTNVHDEASDSAKKIRQALYAGDFPDTIGSPELIREALQNGFGKPDAGFYTTLLYTKIAGMQNQSRDNSGTTAQPDGGIPEAGEGLMNRLLKNAAVYHPFEELVKESVTRRYPASRVRRILMNLTLGITEAEREACGWDDGPAYLRILGTAREQMLAAVGRRAELPLVVRASDLEGLSGAAKNTFAAEARTTDLYMLSLPGCRHYLHGYEYTRQIEKTRDS